MRRIQPENITLPLRDLHVDGRCLERSIGLGGV
jgi:hypothetical protein